MPDHPHIPRPTHRRSRRAFTLLETLIASAILTFSVAAIAQSIVVGQAQTYEALHAQRAVFLAEALLEEILAVGSNKPTSFLSLYGIGPDLGEITRDLFNNIDDFHGLTDGVGLATVTDALGIDYPDVFQLFSRAVSVVSETVTVPGLGAVAGHTLTVTVTDERGRQWHITRFVPEPLE